MLIRTAVYDGVLLTNALFVLALSAVAVFLYNYLLRPAFPAGAPKVIRENYPVLGAIDFFRKRRELFDSGKSQTSTGNFSFYVGKLNVIGLTSEQGRQVFFENRALSFSEGYAVLFGQNAKPPKLEFSEGESKFSQHFGKRLIQLVKRENIYRNLPNLISDVRAKLQPFADANSGIMEPFDIIYKIVFQLTMRTVGCNDFADDPVLLEKTLALFEYIDKSATSTGILFPWLPTPARIKRDFAGARLYMMFRKVAEERKKLGKRDNDALQFLLDEGDTIGQIMVFVVGALFAGLLNTGINAAAICMYLATNSEWMAKARGEVESVAARHRKDANAPLAETLAALPDSAWEEEFPVVEMCLRESIRLQTRGTAFRRNNTGRDIPVGKEIIPNGAFVTYHIDEVHMNPNIYPEPDYWDPSRYLPERAEDQKVHWAYLGWGVGRHPCLGMRFAQLEVRIVTAFFLAMFDFELVDENGNLTSRLPKIDRNGTSAGKPDEPVFLKYKVRDQMAY
ncbi:cytochrome P450 6A1 [Lineolata rhizophorae]|uniref:Cytochrome P450 6A1 n=1 Tax=Lineolata rhizophorae TaxID=578093 RepID=A0A6A6NY57_9PEZI|nr:cytochrome P450 6A1 [Lineolata rhizophorae]